MKENKEDLQRNLLFAALALCALGAFDQLVLRGDPSDTYLPLAVATGSFTWVPLIVVAGVWLPLAAAAGLWLGRLRAKGQDQLFAVGSSVCLLLLGLLRLFTAMEYVLVNGFDSIMRTERMVWYLLAIVGWGFFLCMGVALVWCHLNGTGAFGGKERFLIVAVAVLPAVGEALTELSSPWEALALPLVALAVTYGQNGTPLKLPQPDTFLRVVAAGCIFGGAILAWVQLEAALPALNGFWAEPFVADRLPSATTLALAAAVLGYLLSGWQPLLWLGALVNLAPYAYYWFLIAQDIRFGILQRRLPMYVEMGVYLLSTLATAAFWGWLGLRAKRLRYCRDCWPLAVCLLPMPLMAVPTFLVFRVVQADLLYWFAIPLLWVGALLAVLARRQPLPAAAAETLGPADSPDTFDTSVISNVSDT